MSDEEKPIPSGPEWIETNLLYTDTGAILNLYEKERREAADRIEALEKALLTPKDGEVAKLVERLRALAGDGSPYFNNSMPMREAADLLTRLSAQLAEAARPADVVPGLERAVEIAGSIPDMHDPRPFLRAALRAEIEKERAR